MDSKSVAVIHRSFQDQLPGLSGLRDSTASISLSSYQPDHLVYQFRGQRDQLAIFSDAYYKDGWNAYIDGQPADHLRANYILRGMQIPAGDHQIEFKFEPAVIQRGGMISLGSSVLFVLILAWSVYSWKQKQSPKPES